MKVDSCPDSASFACIPGNSSAGQSGQTRLRAGLSSGPYGGVSSAGAWPDLSLNVFFHLDTGSVSSVDLVAVSDTQRSVWDMGWGIAPLDSDNRAGYKTEAAKWTWDPMASSKL